MKILSIIRSVLSAFFGVQTNSKFKSDEEFIEKHGVKYFLIVGFIMIFLGLVLLSILVNFILN
jgi:hypothetical protein|tara:strand:+ start:135 stop:323 length:189 start_codon:yes stop_codon:yes gene_type:complete